MKGYNERPDVMFYDGHKYMVSNVFRLAKEAFKHEGFSWGYGDICPCRGDLFGPFPRMAIIYPHTTQPKDCAPGIRRFSESNRDVRIYIPVLIRTDDTADVIMGMVGEQENVRYILSEDQCAGHPGSLPFGPRAWDAMIIELKSSR
jgi:hypothetical protein